MQVNFPVTSILVTPFIAGDTEIQNAAEKTETQFQKRNKQMEILFDKQFNPYPKMNELKYI